MTPEENVINDSNVEVSPQPDAPGVEAPAEPTEKAEEAKGLSLRDSLEVAIASEKAPEKEPKTRSDKLEVSYKGKRGREEAKLPEAKPEPVAKVLQAPSEWNKEEKADFEASTPKQQEAALRLHRSRSASIEEIRRSRAELQHLERLSQDVEPFLRAMGNKDPSPVAIQKALKMWADFEKAEDPRQAAAEYLRAKGKGDAIPEDWTASDAPSKQSQENATLLKELNDIKQRLAREDHAKALQPVVETLQEFEGTKNAAGKPKFPSFRSDDTSPEGVAFAGSFGSLVNGVTPFSKEFIARTQSRIPNLTRAQLFEEAYKFSGGLVDDSPAPRPQATQKHIQQSSRAASSVPGNGSSATSSGQVKRYKTTREAAAAALAELRELEGD
jgi:hypothetical protein